jgi:NAD(P)-dependent dehydrogenase (short-subunit alcohol dehydrogenase family)
MRLGNQVAVITGAGRGIGRAIALTFAAEGADIVAVARTEKEIEDTCHEVEGLGRQGLAVPTDITKANQIDRMVEKAISRFKKIDILVNNAGIMRIAPALELAEFDWDAY